MEYSCSNYELKCNECGRRFGNRPLSGCPDCLAPLEVHYDLNAIKQQGSVTRATMAAGPFNIWRYAALLPIPEGFQPGSSRWLHAADPRPQSRPAHWGGQPLRQERRRLLSYLILQGSCRLGCARKRTGVRLRHRRLLVHRKPRELGRRTGRAPGTQGHHLWCQPISSPPRSSTHSSTAPA